MIPEGYCETFDYIRGMEHGVIIAVGSGKQGKSCSLHSLVAQTWDDRPVYMLDTADFDISIFPGYRKASEPNEVPVGSIVIIDDVNRTFPSRGSSRDNTLQRWLGVISHKSTVVCITTQSMADTDVAFVRSQDTVFLRKYMHQDDIMFERPEYQADQIVANCYIDEASFQYPDVDRRSWCFFPKFNECVPVPKVPWWSYRNSHMLRDVAI
jgi:hypothetical protein